MFKKKMFITILLPFDKIFEVRWYFFFKSNPKLLNIKSEKQISVQEFGNKIWGIRTW